MNIARVFARRTEASPTDPLAFYDAPGLFPPDVDAVHVSCAFTWDMDRAYRLAREWERVAPVTVGGPAFGDGGDVFTPGRYLRTGYVITSRGCPRKCKHCFVPEREGPLRELPITEGWIVQDNNLLACSVDHFRGVLRMLSRQKQRALFTGGLDARLVTDAHVDALADLKLRPICFFAFDTARVFEPLRLAVEKMLDAGFTIASHNLRCYVLIGYRGDTMEQAETRLKRTVSLGLMPFAMLYRDSSGLVRREWRQFQRLWARPQIVGSKMS